MRMNCPWEHSFGVKEQGLFRQIPPSCFWNTSLDLHVYFMDWLNVITLTEKPSHSHWLTKWHMPLSTERYHSNTLNCTPRIQSLVLTASSGDCHQPRQAPESPQLLLTDVVRARSLTAPERRVEAAAVVCCVFVSYLRNSFYMSSRWTQLPNYFYLISHQFSRFAPKFLPLNS